MKVIERNCQKKQSKDKQRKAMASLGILTYLCSAPKIRIDVIPVKKPIKTV